MKIIFFILFFVSNLQAALIEKNVQYKEGKTLLEGYLVYDDSAKERRPGVLVVHEWMGLDNYAKKRARDIAELGYVAFAADIYGKGVVPKDAKEAAQLSGKYKSDRNLLRRRINAALSTLRAKPMVDRSRLGAIGYCFGGTTVLELARSGANVKGVVSFHGGLDNPQPSGKKILSKILVLHGAIDPHVPPKEVSGFESEMKKENTDWYMISYGGAVHKFSNPEAGSNVASGAAYNEAADKRSWQAMKNFFEEIF